MKQYLTIAFIFLCNIALSQQWDSSNLVIATDTLLQKSIQKADSITHSFQNKADSINALYQKQFSKIDSVRNRFQSKIDSLNNLNLPTDKIASKIDSLNQIVNTKLSALTEKVDALKSNATKSLNEINLPPPWQEPMQKLQSSINDYSPPSIRTSSIGLPSVEKPGFMNAQLPTLSKQLNLGDNFGNINDLAGKAGGYAQDAQNIVKGDLNQVKYIDKTLESKLSQMDGMDQLNEGSALVKSIPTDSAAVAEKAAELAKAELMEMAQDHFGDKKEVLMEAMNKISKLKSKYSEVKSLAELPKKQPNPLKGKPFIERLLPALTFQIQKSDYFLLDVNPMLMYLITPRISVGAGWNQRLPIDDDLTIKKEESIYGPRIALEVKWTKGINFRLLPEIMNTTIPPLIAQSKGVDPAYREWIGSLFVGIKKDFVVYKQIKGNSEVLYNLYDPDGMSPYADKLSVRFGFEFPMKKKNKVRK